MTLRIVCTLVVGIMLAGCNQEAAKSVAPPPVALTSDAMGVFCGMNLIEHPGPKGQIITAGRIDPFWFTSVRDTVAFFRNPRGCRRFHGGQWRQGCQVRTNSAGLRARRRGARRAVGAGRCGCAAELMAQLTRTGRCQILI